MQRYVDVFRIHSTGRCLLLWLTTVGCSQDYVVKAGQGELVVTPALTDLGMVAVGDTVDFDLALAAPRGEVRVLAVDVLNVEGSAFSFSEDLPTVPAEGSGELWFQYSPTEPGLHYAQLTVVTDEGDENEHLIEVRAEAVELQVRLAPDIVDFGPVEFDTTKEAAVWIRNEGRMDVVVDAFAFDGDGFSAIDSVPLTVPAKETVEVTLAYSAASDSEAVGSLSLDMGPLLTLDEVVLRANACSTASGALYDQDGDGYGYCATDCNDFDPNIHPGLPEVCDGLDNDCNGVIDEGTECFDDDGDGYTEEGGDCNDSDAAISPGIPEQAENGIDDDCDGIVDDGAVDADGDGYTTAAGDCDDSDDTVYPGAPELADDVDNDCDGTIDEGTVAYDDDGDGVTEKDGDCDDTDATIYPSAPETADFVDNDCDGTIDEGTNNHDDDGDGFTEIGGDCDDTDSSINPAEPEVVGDGIDNDCDGVTE